MNLRNKRKVPKGRKAMKGHPLIYDEVKKRYDLTLTPSAYQVLYQMAEDQELSVSETLERHLRKLGGLPIPVKID